MDTLSRLKRLLDLIPPGSLRDQVEMELARLKAESKMDGGSELEQLQKRRVELGEMFNQGCDLLNDLSQRVGQDSPDFDRCFAEWLRLKNAYESVCDQIVVIEARMQLAEWLKNLPPPRHRVSGLPKEGK